MKLHADERVPSLTYHLITPVTECETSVGVTEDE